MCRLPPLTWSKRIHCLNGSRLFLKFSTKPRNDGFAAVDHAASYLCGRLELIELYVSLIDEPKKAKFAVEALTFVLRDDGGRSLSIEVQTPETIKKCKAAWVKLVAENREKLKEKKPFSRE